tara:strand:+ start:114155 stop:114889 length:735 start_codon:yes stop_codon:yes gene_type:complete
MKTAWYLGHRMSDVAESAILVGDPDRIERIAAFLDAPNFLPVKRGLRTVTGTYKGKRVTAASFGMGAPIATIVMNELAYLGTKRFMRVGTAMFFPPAQPGSFMLSEGVRSFEGTSPSYVDDANAQVASMKLNAIVRTIATGAGDPLHQGVFATFDAFYRDMFPLDKQTGARVDANTQMLLSSGAIAADMETSALVNAAHYLKVDFTSLCVATVDGQTRQKLDPKVLEPKERRMFEMALETIVAG